MDTDDFHSTTALHSACKAQIEVAEAALGLLRLMDGAGDFGAEGAFDASRKSVAGSLHDTVRVDCETLGKIAASAGFAIGADLMALSRQLDVSWVARYDAARMTAAIALAAE